MGIVEFNQFNLLAIQPNESICEQTNQDHNIITT